MAPLNILLNNGPVYGYYASSDSAHLIIVTGVNVNKNRVYTNNPWGLKASKPLRNLKKELQKSFIIHL